jgi:hypothetical protein
MKYLRGPNAPDKMVGVMKRLGRPMIREKIGEVIHRVKDKYKIGAGVISLVRRFPGYSAPLFGLFSREVD